ncbi:hypothetical protein, conserved [Plasmodium gonderi]|uniref:Uncharacterized protein n=1 Tax=Plasmodium gonderi TaxID=77519 RepID=A0A1Y1JF15_PLAGO|nr:hypothetical protein, conserved [Plasmodium gonderi]GAW80238.1 hypothetical protein, conserved [Plasmodium gonderi]
MEGDKDNHCYQTKHINPCRVLSSIAKYYCCNKSDVESFNFSEKHILLGTDKNNNNVTDDECIGILKRGYDCSRVPHNENFEGNVNVKQVYKKNSSKLSKNEKTSRNYDFNGLNIKNETSSYAYLEEKFPYIIQKNSPFSQNISYTPSETKKNELYIPGVNVNKNVKIHSDHYTCVEECYAKKENQEKVPKKEPYENRSNINITLSECKKFNCEHKNGMHHEKVDNVNSQSHFEHEHPNVYNNITMNNNVIDKTYNTKDELILEKIKTMLQISDKKKGNGQIEHLMKDSNTLCVDDILQYETPLSPVLEKRLLGNNESNNTKHELENTCKNGKVISKEYKENENETCPLIFLSKGRAKEQPLLVDNFSQTLRKKKKTVKIKKRLKLGLNGRKKKKIKNTNAQKKMSNMKNFNVRKVKVTKFTCPKKRYSIMNKSKQNYYCNMKRKIPIINLKKGFLHIRNKKDNQLRTKNAKECTQKRISTVKKNKKKSSDVNKGVNNYSLRFNSSKDRDKDGKNYRQKNILTDLAKFSNKNSLLNKKKIIKNIKSNKEKKHCSVSKNGINDSKGEAEKHIMPDNLDIHGIVMESSVNCGIQSDEVYLMSTRDTSNPRVHKILIENVRSNSYDSVLSGDISNSSHRSSTMETYNSKFAKIKEYFEKTNDIPCYSNEEYYTCSKSGSNRDAEENFNDSTKSVTENIKNCCPNVKNYFELCAGNGLNYIDLTKLKIEFQKSNLNNDLRSLEHINRSTRAHSNDISDKFNFELRGVKNVQKMLRKYDEKNRTNLCNKNLKFVVLKKVAHILKDAHENTQSFKAYKEGGGTFDIIKNDIIREKLSNKLKFDDSEKCHNCCEMRLKEYVRSRSNDSFFEKTILITKMGYTKLMNRHMNKEKCLKDRNMFLFSTNLLKQRSFFLHQGTYENEVVYILNCLTFYSYKMKNLLNYSIKRRQQNEQVLEVKFFTLCLIYLIEKVKKSRLTICLKGASNLIYELVRMVRYGILKLPPNVEDTKLELVIMKIYLIELIKMSRLLLTSLGCNKEGKIKISSNSSSIKDTSLVLGDNTLSKDKKHTDLSLAGKEVAHEMNKLKGNFKEENFVHRLSLSLPLCKRNDILFSTNGKTVYEKRDNNNSATKDNKKFECSEKHLCDRGTSSAGMNSIFKDKNDMIKRIDRFKPLQNCVKLEHHMENNPNYCGIYEIMKKLKKDVLLLEQNSYKNSCNLRLLMKYLDKLSYIYKVNTSLSLELKKGEILADEIKKVLQHVKEKIIIWKKMNETLCDISTLYSIKRIQKKMEKIIFTFFGDTSEKQPQRRDILEVSSCETKYNYVKNPRDACFPLIEEKSNLNVINKGGTPENRNQSIKVNDKLGNSKMKLQNLSKNDEKEMSIGYGINGYHDETEHLNQLNDDLNEAIQYKKEEFLTKPNNHYTTLKEYKEELSLMNDLQNSDNILVNDSLDYMNISEFATMLDDYVNKNLCRSKLGETLNGSNVEYDQNDIGISQHLNAFFTKQNAKKRSGVIPLEVNPYKDIHTSLNSEKCRNLIKIHGDYSSLDGKPSYDESLFSCEFCESHDNAKHSKSKSFEFITNNGNNNIVKYFKIYSQRD